MYQIPLTPVPNQSISFTIDSAFWTVHIYQSILHMCADITCNGAPVIQGVRCFSGSPLMPYPYMYEPNFGNFIFDTDGDWTNFGSSCNLYYLESSEFEEFQDLIVQSYKTNTIGQSANGYLLDPFGNPFTLDTSVLG